MTGMKRQVYGLVRKFNVLYRKQVDAFFPGRKNPVKRAIKQLLLEGRIYCSPSGKTVAVNETACRQRDDGMLDALWVVAELNRRGLVQDCFPAGKEEYPVRIVVAGKGEMYDILAAEKEEERPAAGILGRIALPDCKHIVVVENMGQAGRIPFKQVFAFCTVSEEGKVVFYEGKQTGREA